jgi:hypothetical protein
VFCQSSIAAEVVDNMVPHVGFPATQKSTEPDAAKLREVFDDFVGQTFFSQMMAAMRKSVGQPAYFHGGRAEEVFQGQLDQMLAERISDATADRFSQPMFELFQLSRQ